MHTETLKKLKIIRIIKKVRAKAHKSLKLEKNIKNQNDNGPSLVLEKRERLTSLPTDGLTDGLTDLL